MAIKPKSISHAVFNNNPGNIKHSVNGKELDYLKVLDKLGIKYSKGSEAADGGYFIKFESHADGYKAAKAWWPTVKSWAAYEGLTLDQALEKYSGEGYSTEKLEIDLDGSKLLSDFTNEELGGVMTSQIKMEDPKEYEILKNEGLLSEEVEETVEETVEEPTLQYQTVLGPNGEEIRIPIGEDVTESDIRKKQTGGEQRYKSWKELEDNISKLDKSRPFYIAENRYKWNEDKKKALLVDEKGEYLPNERQIKNEQFQNIFKGPRIKSPGGSKEGESPKEIVEEKIITPNIEVVSDEEVVSPQFTPRESNIGDIDNNNNNIPDYLEVDPKDTKNPSTTGQKVMGGLGSLVQGAGAALDALGGPGAIISYIMGKKGLKEAMKEIQPQASPQLSPMFMKHLRQTKELAKKGFHPSEEMKIRKEIDGAYQKGLENAVRGSGGQRATFLAQSGVLDAQRSSALLDYAVKDEELQRKNAEKYEKMMLFKENFDIQRTDRERTEDMERQAATKKAAIEFTSAAFTNAMSGLNGATGILQNFFSNNTNRGIGVNSPDNLSEE